MQCQSGPLLKGKKGEGHILILSLSHLKSSLAPSAFKIKPKLPDGIYEPVGGLVSVHLSNLSFDLAQMAAQALSLLLRCFSSLSFLMKLGNLSALFKAVFPAPRTSAWSIAHAP